MIYFSQIMHIHSTYFINHHSHLIFRKQIFSFFSIFNYFNIGCDACRKLSLTKVPNAGETFCYIMKNYSNYYEGYLINSIMNEDVSFRYLCLKKHYLKDAWSKNNRFKRIDRLSKKLNVAINENFSTLTLESFALYRK